MDATKLRQFLTTHRIVLDDELSQLEEQLSRESEDADAKSDASLIDLAVERGLCAAEMVADATALLADSLPDGLEPLLPGLVLLQEIGRGSSGRVFRAWQVKLRRMVAVKVLPRESLASERAKTRFIREARIAARLSHPALVRAWDIGSAGQSVFIILEYVEGETLQARLQREGPLPLRETLEIALDIAEGLAYAAANGIAHRDIKPANIQLTKHGVKILDLGLARPEGETEMTLPMVALGTPAYISPEQARGEGHLTPKTDVYALGVVIFRAVSGRHPFTAIDGSELLRAHIERMPPALTSVVKECPRVVSELVETMMAKDPVDRPDAAALAAHFRHLIAQLRGKKAKQSQRIKRSTTLAPSALPAEELSTKGPRVLVALSILAVLGLAIGGFFLIDSWAEDAANEELRKEAELERERKAGEAAKARAKAAAAWQRESELIRRHQIAAEEAQHDQSPDEVIRKALAENDAAFSGD